MRTITRDIVAILIFSRDGKLLQGKKDPVHGGVYADCWHIPGGGVEDGEDYIPAVIREAKEEVGVLLRPDQIALVDDRGAGESEKVLKETGERVLCQMKFFVYKAVLNSNAVEVPVILSDDLVEYRWFGKEELKKAKLTPPSVALFTRLGYL
jgi:8-oxo-dGTP pyrophosphatase MutT (NUDIX family)